MKLTHSAHSTLCYVCGVQFDPDLHYLFAPSVFSHSSVQMCVIYLIDISDNEFAWIFPNWSPVKFGILWNKIILMFNIKNSWATTITKTRLFKCIENFTSKNWKFSAKKLRYFLYFCSKHRLWYSLEPPRRGGSNDYPQSMFLSRNKKK